MYTNLLQDSTDVLYDSELEAPPARLIGYIIARRRARENYAEGITTSGLTVGNADVPGFVELLPTGSQASYVFRNDLGELNLLQKNSNVESPLLTISSSMDLTLSPLQMTGDPNDTTELVPILVDQNGRLYRGHSLFQTIAQLTQRIQALEAAGSVQLSERISSVETLTQRLRARYNDLHLSSSAI
jgi:hypothetical protein